MVCKHHTAVAKNDKSCVTAVLAGLINYAIKRPEILSYGAYILDYTILDKLTPAPANCYDEDEGKCRSASQVMLMISK